MPKLAELPDDVRVAFFGKWDGVDSALKVEAPDEDELCHSCIYRIGFKPTGASVKDADDRWVHYHGECYMELLQASTATEVVADRLDAELEDDD